MSNDILKNLGIKAYTNIITPKNLKCISKSEKEKFIIYNINNFCISFRENLADDEKINLKSKIEYFPKYPLNDYIEYFKKTDYFIETINDDIYISLTKSKKKGC